MKIERLRQQSALISRQFTKTNDSPQTKDLHGFFFNPRFRRFTHSRFVRLDCWWNDRFPVDRVPSVVY